MIATSIVFIEATLLMFRIDYLLLHAVEEGRRQVGVEEVGAAQQVVRLVQRPRRQLQRHAPPAPRRAAAPHVRTHMDLLQLRFIHYKLLIKIVIFVLHDSNFLFLSHNSIRNCYSIA